MRNQIKTVNIYINHCDGLSYEKGEPIRKHMPEAIKEDKEKGFFPKGIVPNGVYIYTETGYCIQPDFYGLHKKEVTPVGIAIIQNGHRLLVALHGSKEGVILSDNSKTCKTSTQFDNIQEAEKDWGGKENTQQLGKAGSPAANYCLDYEIGNIKKGSWWLPSLAELNLMYENKPLVDACLVICGGKMLQWYWHWSSTEYSKSTNWVLSWCDGSRNLSYQDSGFRVRPVSAFL